MTDHFSRQHKQASTTRLLICLWVMAAAVIFGMIYAATTRDFDHEQMSVTRTVAWEIRTND